LTLPWGHHLHVQPHDDIGSALWRFGVYDLALSESVWSLLDESEWAIDAGANIGYVTSLMARRVGLRGKVFAFEPHPVVFQELSENVCLWEEKACVDARPLALSNTTGQNELLVPQRFASNQGLATLESQNVFVTAGPVLDSLSIDVARLDDLFDAGQRFGLMKVDVEGHELKLFAGARTLLESGRIRDILYEDYGESYVEYGDGLSETSQFLASCGYTVFLVRRTPFGVRLTGINESSGRSYSFDPPSSLATRNPERAAARLSHWGWSVLR
jgi:FkbM family methyltransferase